MKNLNYLMVQIIARKFIFIFSKCFKKMVFPIKLLWNLIFLAISGKIIFLFPENMIFFFGRKRKDDLSQNMHANMIFSVHMYKCYKYDIALLPKKQR